MKPENYSGIVRFDKCTPLTLLCLPNVLLTLLLLRPVFFAIPASTTTTSSITKPLLRGELRQIWTRQLDRASSGEIDVPAMLQASNTTTTTITPLFTIGSTLHNNNSNNGSYTPPGVLDGMGAYRLSSSLTASEPPTRIRILINHELSHNEGYPYALHNNDTTTRITLTGARISYLDLDMVTRQVVDAGLAYDSLMDANGQPILSENDLDRVLHGRQGLSRFCSGRLVDAGLFSSGSGVVDRIYFASEEDGESAVGGAYWALDAQQGHLWSLAPLGRGAWENLAPVDTGDPGTTGFILADDTAPYDFDGDGEVEAAPLYLYMGLKVENDNFVQRNGLAGGGLYVLVLNNGETTRPSQFHGTGFVAQGRWVQLDNRRGEPSEDAQADDDERNLGYDSYGIPTQGNLWLQAKEVGAFGFARPEGTRLHVIG